ncbi:MAG: hypothetical protein K2Q03_02790 [Sphingobacteriaceae bacterium]|nr:hypothetical protein [Sphingobacteriaceae bacterium]
MMKKDKFAWCCLGFTMLMPLFIVENIGIYLMIGVVISVLLLAISSANFDKIPQEIKDIDVGFKSNSDKNDWDTDPAYSSLSGNIYHTDD